jgi:Fe-S-cluster containining protein
MGKLDSLKICGECGGHCCSYGGTTATKEEVDKIVKAGFDNHFENISENAYITKWGKDGVCPYQKNTACSIHKVRPLLCRTFPAMFILKNKKREFYKQECPLQKLMSEKEMNDSFELLKKVPDELIISANKYLDKYGKILEKRINKFKLVKVER